MSLPTLRELRLRWTLYGPLPRCTTDPTDSDWGNHCWGLIWPWQRQEGHMHLRCRPSDERVPEPTGEIATVESALRGADEFGRVIRVADDVWRQLEEQPGFSEELRQAEKDISEGRGTPFRDIRRVPESEER